MTARNRILRGERPDPEILDSPEVVEDHAPGSGPSDISASETMSAVRMFWDIKAMSAPQLIQ